MTDFENPFDDASFDDSYSETNAPLTTPSTSNNIDFFDTQPQPPPIPPKSTPSASVTIDISQPDSAAAPPPIDRRAKELEKRQSELDRRERELNAREAALNRREQDLETLKLASESNSSGAATAGMMVNLEAREPNWPRWPKPIVYQNFNDVPTRLLKFVKFVYFNWMAGEVILLYNVVCALAVTFAGDSGAIGDIILSAIYLCGWSFLSFFIYRRLYKASISGKSLKYFFFFAGFAVQIVFNGFGVAGLRGSGFMGVFWTIHAFKDNTFAGFMCMACAILWGLTFAFCIYIWIHLRVVYKEAGGLKATKEEASEKATEKAVGFAKDNPDVVMGVAATGAKAAMSSSSSSSGKKK